MIPKFVVQAGLCFENDMQLYSHLPHVTENESLESSPTLF